MGELANGRLRIDPIDWTTFIPQNERQLYRSVFAAIIERNLPFAIGGGVGFSVYSRRWRYTKDVDLYIRPADSAQMTAILQKQGFPDLFEKSKYDRGWSYRGHQGNVIVDLLWGMANYRSWVDDTWLADAPEIPFEDITVRVLPPEELVWSKLYVVQRHRCDWPDVLNIIHGVGPQMDWRRLLHRVGEDAPVLGSLLNLFGWLCPSRARELPDWLWDTLRIKLPLPGPDCLADAKRPTLLGREWFGPSDGVVHV
jgi:hypothetical protein